jgi:hypothetical protein
MYATMYYTATGNLISSRKITQQQLDRFVEANPGTAYIEQNCLNVDTHIVDITTDPHTIIEKPAIADHSDWMRMFRSMLLQDCDWTIGADSPLSDSKKTEWQTYRQALRDLPTQYPGAIASQDDITWPTKPA